MGQRFDGLKDESLWLEFALDEYFFYFFWQNEKFWKWNFVGWNLKWEFRKGSTETERNKWVLGANINSFGLRREEVNFLLVLAQWTLPSEKDTEC